MIYQDVVSPIGQDVLNGYKGTIFAYGQTGTGKTHTMEGKLGIDPSFRLEAGIVPRTLDRLFHQVEMSSQQDLCVRMTLLELYNEEVRDLLATASAAARPVTSRTSGGAPPLGTTSTARTTTHHLKLCEDQVHGGVMVRGLTALPINSAQQGLKYLRIGSSKRSVASTKCNDTSSRSHSICTLTIYSRSPAASSTRSNPDDEEYRVGKLTLVDLAGSESIDRSGANQKRAREAGMINESLLTLGRVINALVEGSLHVPYRYVIPILYSSSFLFRCCCCWSLFFLLGSICAS